MAAQVAAPTLKHGSRAVIIAHFDDPSEQNQPHQYGGNNIAAN
jgi:hypothetical protein